MDKLCITTNGQAPQGMGGKANTTGIQALYGSLGRIATTDLYSLNGMRLANQQAEGPCIAVSRTADGAVVARKVLVR
jgi:hypothetical protein